MSTKVYKPQFRAGPWRIKDNAVVNASDSVIIQYRSPMYPPEVIEANMRLIASAPELFEKIEEITNMFEGLLQSLQGENYARPEAIARVHELLTKITGEE